jgi:hypothetical protein
MASGTPGTDAARQDVLTARDELLEELVRLGAAGRAAVDVKAKVQRNPGKSAAAAGGAAFLAVGGPKRLLRGLKRAVRGPAPAYPKSMLPDEIEKVVRSLGDDGDKVRGKLEREFASYLADKKKTEKSLWRSVLMSGPLRPLLNQAVKGATQRLLEPDPESYAIWLERIRERMAGAKPEGGTGGDSKSGEASSGASSKPADPAAGGSTVG